MSTLDEIIEALRFLFKDEEEARERVLRARERPSDFMFDFGAGYEERATAAHAQIERYLRRRVLRYPYYHEEHFAKLKLFHEVASYDDSVFIMTKYPDGGEEADHQLDKVIEVVKQSVIDNKLTPRLASDKEYHELLWQNVELYTLGCSRGIAIVEDRYRPELNPNVAMEWGWMRAMNKPVMFLMENGFKHRRADWEGLISERFTWEKPDETIPEAVGKHFRKTAVDN